MTINLSMPNWVTTLGGLMAGIPALVLSSGFVVTPQYQHIIMFIGGLGLLLLGGAAKDWNTHSTSAEVAQATAKSQAPPKP
jgi:hypothetical protein